MTLYEFMVHQNDTHQDDFTRVPKVPKGYLGGPKLFFTDFPGNYNGLWWRLLGFARLPKVPLGQYGRCNFFSAMTLPLMPFSAILMEKRWNQGGKILKRL